MNVGLGTIVADEALVNKSKEAKVQVSIPLSRFSLGAALTLALAMWFVPSFGTQGVGTVGRALPHPDRILIADGSAELVATETYLLSADEHVRAALPR